VIVPEQLAATCNQAPERRAWLEQLPQAIHDLQERWALSLGAPFDGSEVSCAWVAPAVRRDGTRAVLKLGMPHMEAAHEIHGLRFWNGDPTVRILEDDVELNAMLLERCEPGTALRALPEEEQDVVIAGLLRRLWRRPAEPHPFRPLASMLEYWAAETNNVDLRMLEELARPSADDVLLATDLHAGNVLRARREPWLAIDPKPFIGDRAYDATQHLLNCRGRMAADPDGTIRRFADLLGVDAERVRLWMIARNAIEAQR
jgi:streptomycin 6-kinase